MANTTFKGPVRSEAGFEQISKNSTTGAITTTLDIDASGNIATTGTINGDKNVADITTATFTVTEAQSGSIFTLNRAGGIVVTLPTASSGLHYKFIVGTTFTGTFSLDSSTANEGYSDASNLLIFDKDAPGTVSAKQFYADGSDDDKIVMDADTKGRFIGGVIDVVGISAVGGSFTKCWIATGRVYGDGSLATPFV
tara:strand:+ start:690 stop:1277 length:588 start_codon:yes stop_codon:yes gene_type:complete